MDISIEPDDWGYKVSVNKIFDYNTAAFLVNKIAEIPVIANQPILTIKYIYPNPQEEA